MRTLSFVAVTCLAAVSSAAPAAPGVDLAGRAKLQKNGSYPDRAEAWEKFSILGFKLGAELEKVPGFVCGPPPGTDGFTTQNHSCVKFLDTRCKGKAAKISHIRASADLPKGQSCFMDEMAGSTYLDRKYTETPLPSVRLIGTDTSSPLVFQIVYIVPADDLTDESNLGKALIAKYGTPSYKNAPSQMNWELGEVRLAASCRTSQGPTGEYCSITVEDNALDRTERDLQEEANEAAKKKAAPPAPKL